MAMDKKVLYALIGGVALVGAAIAYNMISSGDTADAKAEGPGEDELDNDIEDIGELEIEQGHIKFEQFLKIFQICSFYGKTIFQKEKKKLITERRDAYKAEEWEKYEKLVQEMTQKEEQYVQHKLTEIIAKLGISEDQFQKATMFHGQDQNKGMQIMQMQQTIQPAKDESDPLPTLTKQKTMQVFEAQQQIQMESMDEMMRTGAMNPPRNQIEEMQMMMKMMVQQCKSQDKLFIEQGVEEEHLNASIQDKNLQQDPEFNAMLQANMKKVMMKAQQAQAAAGGGGMGGGQEMLGGGGGFGGQGQGLY